MDQAREKQWIKLVRSDILKPDGWKDIYLHLQLTPALMESPAEVAARLRYTVPRELGGDFWVTEDEEDPSASSSPA